MTDPETHRPAGFHSDLVAGVVAILFGVAMLLLLPSQVAEPVLFFGTPPSALSPKVFPIVAALLIIAFAILTAWRSRILPDSSSWRRTPAGGFANVAISLAAIFAYAFLVVPLGFVVASAIVGFALSTYYGNRNYPLGLAFAVLLPLGIFNLFVHVLKVQLPEAAFLPRLGFM